LTTIRKKVVGRKQREDDRPEAPARPGPVDGRGLDQRFGDGLQPGEEEQEVVGYLLPGGRDDDQIMAWVPLSTWFHS
jgi:hypothetical protein